ncbi:hypothetical protein SCHPADRAFT_897532, partial [Schizopora paradoxa]
ASNRKKQAKRQQSSTKANPAAANLDSNLVDVGQQTVPTLPPLFSSSDSEVGSSLFSSVELQSTPATSARHTPQSSLDSTLRKVESTNQAAMKTTSQPAFGAPSLSPGLHEIFSSGYAPADIIAHLNSPNCTYTFKEKADVYKYILKTSVLAYDAETGESRFSWANDQLSSMDPQAKAAALLHNDHTISSICAVFLKNLEAVESQMDAENDPNFLDPPIRTQAQLTDAFNRLMVSERKEFEKAQKSLEVRLQTQFHGTRGDFSTAFLQQQFTDNRPADLTPVHIPEASPAADTSFLAGAEVDYFPAPPEKSADEKAKKLEKELETMEKIMLRKNDEIKRLQNDSIQYQKTSALLSLGRAEKEDLTKEVRRLTKQVDLLNKQVTNINTVVDKTNEKTDDVAAYLRLELEVRNLQIDDLREEIAKRDARIMT